MANDSDGDHREVSSQIAFAQLAIRFSFEAQKHICDVTTASRIIRFLAVLIALVALSPHSYSQTFDNKLEGIKSVRILVTDLGESSCGVTEDSLRSAASFPIATSPLSFDRSEFVLLVVANIGDLGNGVGCVVGYSVSLDIAQEVTVDATGLRKTFTLTLWEEDGLLWGPAEGFARRVRQKIEDLTKQFVVDWTLDQQ